MKDLNDINGRSKMRDLTINADMAIKKLLRDMGKAKDPAELRMFANMISHRASKLEIDAARLIK